MKTQIIPFLLVLICAIAYFVFRSLLRSKWDWRILLVMYMTVVGLSVLAVVLAKEIWGLDLPGPQNF